MDAACRPRASPGPIGTAQISTELHPPDGKGQPQPGHLQPAPVPILDGGVILLLLIEMLMRRDLSLNVKEAVLKLGFVVLIIVVVFVLYDDISKILPG